jgi:SAM-dependent methyltransferase
VGIGYKFLYRKLKEWLWATHLSKRMPARANYYLQTMPNLKVKGWGLDIGCGDGLVTSQVAIKYVIKMVGIDLARHHSYKGTFLLTDATRLPFKDEIFSLATCFSLIEHIQQEQRAELYREVYRVLCPGGYLVIQHPNRFFPIEQHSYLPFIGYLPSQLHGFLYHDYYRIPSKNKLLADLRSAGFKLTRLDILEAPYLPLSNFLIKIKIFRLLPFGYLITMRKPLTSEVTN